MIPMFMFVVEKIITLVWFGAFVWFFVRLLQNMGNVFK